MLNIKLITYCGEKIAVVCDRRCDKAWGIQNRPKVQLSDDPDDFYFLPDDELGQAPCNPGTYEGGHGKPVSPDEFPNKWCVRECERCRIIDIVPENWNERRYNQPWKHQD